MPSTIKTHAETIQIAKTEYQALKRDLGGSNMHLNHRSFMKVFASKRLNSDAYYLIEELNSTLTNSRASLRSSLNNLKNEYIYEKDFKSSAQDRLAWFKKTGYNDIKCIPILTGNIEKIRYSIIYDDSSKPQKRYVVLPNHQLRKTAISLIAADDKGPIIAAEKLPTPEEEEYELYRIVIACKENPYLLIKKYYATYSVDSDTWGDNKFIVASKRLSAISQMLGTQVNRYWAWNLYHNVNKSPLHKLLIEELDRKLNYKEFDAIRIIFDNEWEQGSYEWSVAVAALKANTI